MQYTSSSVDITVKISEFFEQQTNYEKSDTQPLLGYNSIYTEQAMTVMVLEILLSLPKLMRSLQLFFQIL